MIFKKLKTFSPSLVFLHIKGSEYRKELVSTNVFLMTIYIYTHT